MKVKLSDGSVVLLATTYSEKRLRALLKSRTLSSEESMYYTACLRYLRSSSDLDRRIWLHIASELRKLLGSCLREGVMAGGES